MVTNMIPIKKLEPDSLIQAAGILRGGGLVAFPTETVYGLGADALNPLALAKVFAVKQRPYFDPLIVHVAERSWLVKLCVVSPQAEKLMDAFWPGALTLVLPKLRLVPDLATAGHATVAVRQPSHLGALALLQQAGIPIAAPSANPFGQLSPTTAEHVQKHFTEGIDLILDGGPCNIGVESTVLSLVGETAVLLRSGGVSKEAIEALIGPIQGGLVDPIKPEAPGQLPQHYSPLTPFKVWSEGNFPDTIPQNQRLGILRFKNSAFFPTEVVEEILSPSGDLNQAATNLFAALHRLDGLSLDMIWAESVPEKGLGLAIMDRLNRAAAKAPI